MYFSPNGDGNQDTVTINHMVTAPSSDSLPAIKSTVLKINDYARRTIRTFTYTGALPPSSLWDGKNDSGVIQADGNYTFAVTITTTDNAIINATAGTSLNIRAKVTNAVVVTSPVTGLVTSNGVITVQGQTITGKVNVDICVDTLGAGTSCDSTTTVPAVNGFFSAIVMVPRVVGQTTQTNISAKARDEYGNTTPVSNIVKVTQDESTVFRNTSVTQTVTGVNTSQDYADFLAGKISIDKLKKLVIRTEVSQNTEAVNLAFSKYINASIRPDQPTFQGIATINNVKETNSLINYLNLESVKKNQNKDLSLLNTPTTYCQSSTGCLWEYYLPIPSDWGGIYEIQYTGKKAGTIQTQTAGFKVDGNVPLAPLFLSAEKLDGTTWKTVTPYNKQYYVNKNSVKLRGAADPNALLELYQNGVKLGEITSNASGVFDTTIVLPTTPTVATYTIDVKSVRRDSNGVVTNTTASANPITLKYDVVAPTLTTIKRTTAGVSTATTTPLLDGWLKTGNPAKYVITPSETLIYSDIVREDGYVQLMSSISSTWSAMINADRILEGNYNVKFNIIDLAGNITTYNSTNYTSALGDYRLYIDNTVPASPTLDRTGWGIDNGIKADGILPEADRTTPNFVTKANTVTIRGKAEMGQYVRIRVNNVIVATPLVSSTNCMAVIADKLSSDGVMVKSGSVCDFSYTYTFTDAGRSDESGVALSGYAISAQVVDKSGNESVYAPLTSIGHDTQAPDFGMSSLPLITNKTSVQGSYFGERLIDIQSKVTTPKGVLAATQLGQMGADRTLRQTYQLGSVSDDRPECVSIINGRRIGNCEDGIYNVAYQGYDSAGNANVVQTSPVERDTVPPADPTATMYLAGNALMVTIGGEVNASIRVQETNSGMFLQSASTTMYLGKAQCGSINYTYSFTLVDLAGNISMPVSASLTTAPCPPPPPPITPGTNGGSTGSGTGISYAIPTPLANLDENEIPEPESDIWVLMNQSAMNDIDKALHDPLFAVKLYYYYTWGIIKGAGMGVWDSLVAIKDLVTHLDQVGSLAQQFWQGIKQLLNPKTIGDLIGDKAEEFFTKDSYGKAQMMGEMIGQFIPDIVTAIISAGIVTAIKNSAMAVKIVSGVSTALQTMRIYRWANKWRGYVVAGVKIVIHLTENATVPLRALFDGTKDLAYDAFKKVITTIVLNPAQKAYLIVKKVGIAVQEVATFMYDTDDLFAIVKDQWVKVDSAGIKMNYQIVDDIYNDTGVTRLSDKLTEEEFKVAKITKIHPISGVPIDENGFPIFKAQAEAKLKSEEYLLRRDQHNVISNQQLYEQIQSNSILKQQFTAEDIELFKSGKHDALKYRWHHHQDAGRMQLVDAVKHTQTRHVGGYSIWGLGK
jgi:DNase/tRNase domain of colicin-like bacteriocin/Bacterial Ig-like domain